MQLGRLTRLGRADLETEQTELTETITGLQEILGDENKLREVIVDELGECARPLPSPAARAWRSIQVSSTSRISSTTTHWCSR